MNTLSIRLLIYVWFVIVLQNEDGYAQNLKVKTKDHRQAVEFINKRTPELIALSDSIWKLAEPSFTETKSSALLVAFLRKEGFAIQEHVSGFPTAFIATYGEGKPAIGLYGEYDADPGASNLVVPRRAELEEGQYGHGGGHNLLGVGSIGAALAVKDLIARKKLRCTVRYYGTTGEGTLGSKTYLARDGYFNDLDLSLYWHPAPVTVASTAPWDALFDIEIILSARKLNVIQDTEHKPTTTEALELLLHELNAMRSMTNQGKKFNYELGPSDHSLDETPDTTRVTLRIQCARQSDANQLFQQVQAAANQVSEKSKVQTSVNVIRALHQFLPNVKAMETVYQNLQSLGSIQYSDEEIQFVRELQQHLGVPVEGMQDRIVPFSDQSGREELYGYASDIGDASWISPELYFVVTSLPAVPMHQWPATIFTGHTIGHKGMIQASKVLTLTIIDYLKNPGLQKSIREDFERRRKSYRYHSFLPDGPPQITKSINHR